MQDTVKSLYGDQALIRNHNYVVTKKVKAGEMAADYRHQNPIKKIRTAELIAVLATGIEKTCW
jgi:hypothetical protein